MPEPPPIPPREPSMDQCCRSGCMVCIFDLYEDELVRYEAALREWQERQPAADSPAPPIVDGSGETTDLA